MAGKEKRTYEIDGRQVVLTSPSRVVFPEAGITKQDLFEYYLAVGPGALRGVAGRPMALKRYVKGIADKPFFQKRAPTNTPAWLDTVTLRYASGHSTDELVVRDLAGLAWVVNLGCVDLNPHPIRATDLERPDELRVDLDPIPGVPWSQVRDVALVCRDVLEDHDLVGWPKTSGSRGMHLLVRIAPRWTFRETRRAALALAAEVERRAPELATARWFKEERHGVFVDYNQMAYDRTTASAYSVRPLPDARVSTPLSWDEVPTVEPEDHTLFTVPARFAERGDPHAGMDTVAPGDLTSLLELADALDVDEISKRGPDRKPLIIVAQSPDHDAAMAGLERWKARHPEVVARLEPHHVLIDKQRGRSSTWTRVRINLEAVPAAERPPQQTPDPDDDPTRAWRQLMRES